MSQPTLATNRQKRPPRAVGDPVAPITIEFTVVGKQITQGSKKAIPIYKKGGVPVMKDRRMLTRVVEDNPKLAVWRQEVAAAARQVYDGPLLTGAVTLTLAFLRVRPKSHYGSGRNAGILKASAPQYLVTTPDSLKLARAVEDALSGVVWRDDSQIVEHHIRKDYGSHFHLGVLVESLDGLTEGEEPAITAAEAAGGKA